MTRALAQQDFEASFAQTDADLRAAQRLRYEVFVKELGAAGQGVDHDARLETDHFDAFADHLLLRNNRDGEVVGVEHANRHFVTPSVVQLTRERRQVDAVGRKV